jgi:hypothetical protein
VDRALVEAVIEDDRKGEGADLHLQRNDFAAQGRLDHANGHVVIVSPFLVSDVAFSELFYQEILPFFLANFLKKGNIVARMLTDRGRKFAIVF